MADGYIRLGGDRVASATVANGTATDNILKVAVMGSDGAAINPLPSTYWRYAAASGGIASSTADVVLKAAGGASVVNCLSSLTINHDTLGAVTECVIKDGSTVIWRAKLQTAATDVGNGAGSLKFDPPLRGTANTALNFALSTSVTGGVFVNAQGFTST